MSNPAPVHFDLTGENSDLVKALEGAERGMTKLDKKTKEADKSSKKMEQQQKKTAKATTDNKEAVDALTSKLGINGAELEKITGLSAGMATAMAGAAVAIAATAAAMFELSSANSEYVDHISNLATQTGLSNETIIAMDLAAGRAGTSIQELQGGVKALVTRFGEAATMGGEAADMLQRYGVSAEDIKRGSRDSEVALRATLDAISKLPTAAERAAAAAKLFGEEGSKLAVVLSDGSAGLDDMAARATELGLVLDEDAIQASADFNAAVTDLKAAAQALAMTLGTETTASVVAVVNALTGIVSAGRQAYEALEAVREVTAWINPLSWAAAGATAAFGASAKKAAKDVDKLTEAEREHARQMEENAQAVEDYGDLLMGITDEQQDERAADAKKREAEEKKQTADAIKAAEERAAAEAASAAASLKSWQETADANIAAVDEVANEEGRSIQERLKSLALLRDDATQTLATRAAAIEAITGLEADELMERINFKVEGAKKEIAIAEWRESEEERVRKEAAEKAEREEEERLAALTETAFTLATTITESMGQAVSGMYRKMAEETQQYIDFHQGVMDETAAQLEADAALRDELREARKAGDEERVAELMANEDLLSKSELRRLHTLQMAQEESHATLIEQQRKQAMAAFAVEKAAAIVSIAINTAKAIMAVAPAGPIAMAGMATAGAVQAGLVAAQQPPEFHAGGIIEARQAAADEVDIRAKAGEFVVNSQGTANNREVLEAMNRGQSGAMSSPTINVYIAGEAIEPALLKIASGDGPASDLFTNPAPKGRDFWK